MYYSLCTLQVGAKIALKVKVKGFEKTWWNEARATPRQTLLKPRDNSADPSSKLIHPVVAVYVTINFTSMLTTSQHMLTKAKTKCWKDPTYAVFWKSRRFKDFKHDNHYLPSPAHLIFSASGHHQCIISASSLHHHCITAASLVHCGIISASSAHHQVS